MVPELLDRSAAGVNQDRAWSGYVAEARANPSPFESDWKTFNEIYQGRRVADGPPLVWTPTPDKVSQSNLGGLMSGLGMESYAELHRWSITNRAEFWKRVIATLDIRFDRPPATILQNDRNVKDPAWLPGAELNIVDNCFAAPGDRPAIVSGSEWTASLESMSYAQLSHLVDQLAGGLRRYGFARGDGIAVYMPMTAECVAAYLAIVKAGCYVVSIADSFSPEEVKRRIHIGGAKGIVTVDAYTRAGKTIALYQKVTAADAPRAIVIQRDGERTCDLRPEDLPWDDLLGSASSSDSDIGPADRLLNVLFSSGTTAEPKAIPWTHLTPLKCAMDGRYHQDIRSGEVVAWPSNVGWMMGPWLIFASFLNGATMALYDGSPASEGFARFVREAGVTVLGVIPSLVRAWRRGGFVGENDWRSVRLFSSTGEASNQEDYLWLMSRARYSAPVIEYLGGTEIGGGHLTGTVVQAASPSYFTTPALGIEVVILDEDGRPASENCAGELFLIPPAIGLTQKLLNRDHHEVYYDDCPAGPSGETLRRHGDRIQIVAQGFHKAAGRADDAMNLGGIKVSCVELERVIDSHEAVYQSAAIGVPTRGEGAEQLVVYVVPAGDGTGEELRAELGKLIAKNLNPLFKIHDLVIVDELPVTASNKVMRRELRRRYVGGVGSRE